jgi:hypothetical protein
MPKEIKKKEELARLLAVASEVRVVKRGEQAKVKLRTKDSLYTFKTTSGEADALLKGTKVTVVEI